MYFSTEPKSRREDVFNYEHEYGLVKAALGRGERVVAVVGVRRVGKTSLLNVLFHEEKCLKVWIDGRIVGNPKKEVFAAIYDAVRLGKPRIFGSIESLNVSAFGVGFGISLDLQSRAEMERKIRGAGRVCVFVDEAQRMKRTDLADVLSYFYDRLPKVSFVISGSEIGLVEEVLGESDAEHPLYGREIVKVQLERLDRNRAMDFLKKGFEQVQVKASVEELEGALNELDGLIGWLTLFGYEKAVLKNKDALEKAVETASRIAASELSHFLKKARNKKLYLAILRNADGTAWEELKSKAGRELGKPLNPNMFVFALNKLKSYSFVEKRGDKYHLSDPLLYKATFLV